MPVAWRAAFAIVVPAFPKLADADFDEFRLSKAAMSSASPHR
jgi:hypothetical protein